MDLETEVSEKIKADPRWKKIPYEYAYICIALCLTYPQAQYGINHRMQPEEVMFKEERFTEEQIRQWHTL